MRRIHNARLRGRTHRFSRAPDAAPSLFLGAQAADGTPGDIADRFVVARIAVGLERCHATRAGTLRWKLRPDTGLRPDLTIVARREADNRRPRDFGIPPRIDGGSSETLRMAETSGLPLDAYRVDDLSPLYRLLRRSPMPRAACDRRENT